MQALSPECPVVSGPEQTDPKAEIQLRGYPPVGHGLAAKSPNGFVDVIHSVDFQRRRAILKPVGPKSRF